ncbi:MAG: hypothetical protein MK066_02230 [Crocinitomicaceae bacterium]|nr:hypothetical protein [Crocinitomicaceae bacterium]
MKELLLITVLLVSSVSFGQKKSKRKPNLKLTNALVIGQVDTAEDRYSLEINLTDMFTRNGVKTAPSLNILKLGNDSQLLATDSLGQIVKAKGYDTYVLVSVKGYDHKFHVTNLSDDFETALGQASFFDLYREGIVSISFEFKFFREGKCVHAEVIKCGNVGSRESVLKRLRKKTTKRIVKRWK